MNAKQLLALHDMTCEQCRKIMEAKNADYCGGSADPFANFRTSSMLGVPPAIGLMMRMTDKMQRIKSFVQNGTLAVKSESFEDACNDMVNYAILLKGMLMDDAGIDPDEALLKQAVDAVRPTSGTYCETGTEPVCARQSLNDPSKTCILPLGHSGHHRYP